MISDIEFTAGDRQMMEGIRSEIRQQKVRAGMFWSALLGCAAFWGAMIYMLSPWLSGLAECAEILARLHRSALLFSGVTGFLAVCAYSAIRRNLRETGRAVRTVR